MYKRQAHDSQVLGRFLALTPLAAKYHAGLLERRGNAISHIRKIVALAEIHGDDAVSRAITDALTFEAFSSEYVAHLIQARTLFSSNRRAIQREIGLARVRNIASIRK